MTPAASGCAYGSRRRSAAAEEAQELEEDGWADEARGIFREHMGRRALVWPRWRSSRLPPRSRSTTRGCASGRAARPREQRMRVSGERREQRAGV